MAAIVSLVLALDGVCAQAADEIAPIQTPRPTQKGRGAFSQDGSLLAVDAGRGAVRLYDPDTGEIARTINRGDGDSADFLAWHPEARLLASAGDGTVVLNDAQTGELIQRRSSARLVGLAWGPDGDRLVGITYKGVIVWETGSDQPIIEVEGAGAWSGALSPDGTQVATIGEWGDVHVWDLETGEFEALPVEYGRCECYLDWNPHSGLLALGGHGDLNRQRTPTFAAENTIRLWDVDAGEVVRDLVGPDKGALTVWSPDGRTLAVAHGWVTRWSSAAPDARITLWDGESGELLHTLQTDEQQVQFLAWSADSRWLASCGGRGTYVRDETDDLGVRFVPHDTKVSLWSVETGKLLRTFGRD